MHKLDLHNWAMRWFFSLLKLIFYFIKDIYHLGIIRINVGLWIRFLEIVRNLLVIEVRIDRLKHGVYQGRCDF